jgi:hypothetical protein
MEATLYCMSYSDATTSMCFFFLFFLAPQHMAMEMFTGKYTAVQLKSRPPGVRLSENVLFLPFLFFF